VLRRLSVFSGEFSLQDAAAIVSDQARLDCPMVDEVTELVSKSLIGSGVSETQPRFRLNHVTRAYALEKLRESGELDAIARRLTDDSKAPMRCAAAVSMLNAAPSAIEPEEKERSHGPGRARYAVHPRQRPERRTLQYRGTAHAN
jgi:predicted ATPase